MRTAARFVASHQNKSMNNQLIYAETGCQNCASKVEAPVVNWGDITVKSNSVWDPKGRMQTSKLVMLVGEAWYVLGARQVDEADTANEKLDEAGKHERLVMILRHRQTQD